ncbi:autophagy protein, partial [Linnemannia elongata]
MNLSARGGDLLFINFNQDFSCISVGTKRGFNIYNCDPFGKCYSKTDSSIGIVEMLFCTSLVAIVGAGDQPASSPRRLQIINTKRLIVVLEDQIYVYDISNMKLLHTIETSPNPHAICALSPSSENCYLAYPSPTPSPTSPFSGSGRDDSHGPSGDVLIFDALTLQVVNIVQAHKTSVSNISINSEGTMLATASDKGTVIRIWSIPNAQRLFQFRRGSQSARIYSLSFNLASTLLSVSSDTDTVHIFKLGGSNRPGDGHRSNGGSIDGSAEKGSGMSSIIRRQSFNIGKNLAGSVGSYLPGAITEIFEPSRDFAHIKLPTSGVQSVIALSSTTPQIMVATSDGYLYQYNIDLENGGPCVLLKQFSLLSSSEDSNGTEPQTPYNNSSSNIPTSKRMTSYSNTMQPPPSATSYNTSAGAGSGNSRWSVSSGFRQSINGGQRNSILNSSVMMSQRPSPMGPLTGDDYGALGSSVMGPPTSGNRRISSFAPRQSMNGPGPGMGFSLLNNVNIRDPRPVKDKVFQRNLILHIVNFLTQTGYPYVITNKNLTQPTNKDFQDIFKFLYLKLEPRYEFQKKFEDEVPVLLKTMRYPAADSISKTSLYTVGTPHSWPNMLALLGWMVDVITIIDKYNELMEAQQMSNAHNRDRDIDPKMDMTQVSPERALYHYLTKTYRVWMLTGNLHDPDIEESMAKSFQRRKEYAEDEVRSLDVLNDTRRQELEAARAEVSPLVALEGEQKTLKKDLEQFKKAIEHGVPRIEEVRVANEETRKNIINKEQKLSDLERAKREVQEIVRTQTTTRAGLETKIEERNRLRRNEDRLKQQVSDLEEQQRTLDKRFQEGESEAERLITEYNALAVKIGIVPRSGKHAGGQDFELRLDLDNAISGTGRLYSIETKNMAERTVGALRNQFTTNVNGTENELMTLKEDLDHLEDQIADKNAEIRIKEYQFGLLSKKHQEDKESARTDAANRQTFTESQEEQLQAMTLEINQNTAEADRLEQENILME